VPVFNAASLECDSQIEEAIPSLARHLGTEIMRSMCGSGPGRPEDPAAVAQRFLRA